MASTLLIGTVMVLVTCVLHYEVLRGAWDVIPRMKLPPRLRILPVVVAIFASHTIAVWLYGGLYLLLETHTQLGELLTSSHEKDFITALYFSAITFSTVGYGDVTPTEHLRLIAAIQAINGLVLIGWSVSFTYLSMEKFWLQHRR